MQKSDGIQVHDQRKQKFTVYDNEIIDSLSFKKPTTKLLYMTICRFSHMQQIFPSIGTLMLLTSISSPNTLKKHLKELEKMKLIGIKDRGRKENGEHYTHEYFILEVPEEISENSVWKAEKVEALKAELKEARKEKSATTNHNRHTRKEKKEAENIDVEASEEGTSNFDGPPSNFDGPPSNFDGPPSNFDHYKTRTTKQELKTNNYKQQTNNKEAVQNPVGELVDYTSDFIFEFYKANAEVTATDKKTIERLYKEYPADLVYGSIEIALNSKTRNSNPLGYAIGILERSTANGVKTLEELRKQPKPYAKAKTGVVPEFLEQQKAQEAKKEDNQPHSVIVEAYKPKTRTIEDLIIQWNDPFGREILTDEEKDQLKQAGVLEDSVTA